MGHYPIIGISANLLTIESGSFIGLERSAVVHDYILAVQKAKGLPIILPVINELFMIEQQMSLIDGLLLSGGYDISPFHYNDGPRHGLEAICPKRDVFEIELARMAYRLKKPILGICRGLQLINVAFGGTLHQDIKTTLPSAYHHHPKAHPEDETHQVNISENTLLHQIFCQNTLLVNSFHHQSIKDLAPNFIVNSHANDGIIEGIEKKDSFILGVQWHPEVMINKHPHMLSLFQALVKAAKMKGEG